MTNQNESNLDSFANALKYSADELAMFEAMLEYRDKWYVRREIPFYEKEQKTEEEVADKINNFYDSDVPLWKEVGEGRHIPWFSKAQLDHLKEMWIQKFGSLGGEEPIYYGSFK